MSNRRFGSCRGRGRDNFDSANSNRLKFLPPIPVQEVEVIDWEAKRKEWDNEKTARFSGLPPVIKNFYKEDESVSKMTKKEVDKCRLENRNITVSYKDQMECLDAPNPVRTFREAWQHFPDLLQLLEGRYEHPSPIQMQLWPVLLSGRDAVGIAQTGTGKTLAFLLPGLVNIMNQDPEAAMYPGPRMIVLAPTRELAQQIHEEVNKLQYSKIKSVCIYGKGDRRKQLDGINGGAQVVVATPGRLDDLMRAKEIDLRRVSYVVFDEADRMLDMGFMPNLSYIITGIREDRQFIMTSATWNDNIHYIAKNYLRDEILVRVGERELEAAYTVSQEVVVCEDEEKFGLLMKFLSKCTRRDKGLVFVNKRVMCDPLSSDIRSHYDYKFTEDTLVPETLYGSMDQEAREEALDSFRKSESRLLICTDVAARGLDVLDVTFVINYDLPLNMEEYVHRSGRTGRAGRTGHVLTFVCWKDRRNVRKFMEILERSKTTVPQELQKLADRSDRSNARRYERDAAEGTEGRGNYGGGGGRNYGGGGSGGSYGGSGGGRGRSYGVGNSDGSYGDGRRGYGGSAGEHRYNDGEKRAAGAGFNTRPNHFDSSRDSAPYSAASAVQVTAAAITPVCADEVWEEDWTGPETAVPGVPISANETSAFSTAPPAVHSDTAWEQTQDQYDYSQGGEVDYSDGGGHSSYYVVQDATAAADQQYYADTGTAGTYTGYQDYYDETQNSAAVNTSGADSTCQQQSNEGYYAQEPSMTQQVAYYTDPNSGTEYYVDPAATENTGAYCTEPNTAGQYAAPCYGDAAAAEGTLDYWNYASEQQPEGAAVPSSQVEPVHHLTAALASTCITTAARTTK